jgi:hypothetical protein
MGEAVKRINLSVDDAFYKELEKLAEAEERTLSNLALYLVKAGYRELAERGLLDRSVN